MRRLLPVLALTVLILSLVIFIGCSKDEDPVTPPPACSIKMATPQAGDTYYTGDPVNIRWETSGTPGTVDIELVSGNLDTMIAAGAANSGFFPWSIKAYGYGTRDNYRVRVTGVGDTACKDSTGMFTIVSLSGCNITFPYSSKDSIPDQMAGDVFTIEWNSTNTSNDLQLELWTTSPWPAYTPKEPRFIIDSSIPDTGSYDWTVSSFNYSDNAVYRWRLRDIHLNTCTATSYHFRIIDNAVCSMIVGGITGGTEYDPGDDVRIDILGTNLQGLVDAELLAGGGAVPGSIIKDFDPTSGPLVWQADDFGFSGTNSYRVRVISVDDPFCTGVSEQFSISR